MPSWTKPTPDRVARALAAIPRPEQANYFFAKLNNPEWLDPLLAKGIFSSPPAPQPDESEGTVGFPLWPQGRYLVKVAAHSAEAVLKTIEHVPSTENFRVHEDFLEAATAMPAAVAVRLAKRALGWWHAPYGRHLAQSLERFLLHLARGGEVTAGLKIAEALLETGPDPEAEKKRREREEHRLRAESLKPQMRTEWWRLRNLLRKGFPELVQLSPRASIQILASTLARVIEYATWQPDARRPIDLSAAWRPAIEKNPLNSQRDARSEVIAALRDGCETALRSNSVTFDHLDEILSRHQWDIFERMRLHLYRLFPELAGARIPAVLTDRGLFERPGLNHERTLLLQEHFGGLQPVEQQTILGWIAEGPPRPELSWTGEPIEDNEWLVYVKRLTLRQLHPIANALPPDWTQRYRALVNEYGEALSGDSRIVSSEWRSGSESPKTLEELRAMSSPEIINFMRLWQPSTDFMAPDRFGLAGKFEQLVAEQPARFASEAGLFRGVEPIYVHSLVRGLRTALEKEQAIEWEPIIELCGWVATQPVELDRQPVGGSHPRDDRHVSWRPTRQEIASLLGVGMKPRPTVIPFGQRNEVWKILSALCDDEEPTAEDEAASTTDPATLAINRVRGVALNQLADYGLWVRRHLAEENPAAPAADFNQMPELRDRLDLHLDRSREPTLMARTSYGRSLPWLYLLDPTWTQEHVLAIFPREEDAAKFRRAAWVSYVCFTRAYDNLLPVLEDEYRWAATNAVEEESTQEHGFAKPGEGLADHLLSFYWRGLLGFDREDDLLVIFYAHASDSLRAHGMWAIGRAFEEAKTPPTVEALARWQKFWEWRFSVMRKDPSANRGELNGFTWWLISDRFEADWALGQMTEVLRAVDSVEHETLISDYLAKVSDRKPLEAVTLLGVLIEKAVRTRAWFVSEEETITVLRNAYQCGEPAAAMRADQARDLLLSIGYHAVREIGPAPSPMSV
ncbi:MAG: hypothetical protein QOH39_1604 [Verrucomicrobiota bacterium]|jgi:hypothetical protein